MSFVFGGVSGPSLDFLSGWDQILLGETVIIPERKQMVVIDGLVLEGELVIEGTLGVI